LLILRVSMYRVLVALYKIVSFMKWATDGLKLVLGKNAAGNNYHLVLCSLILSCYCKTIRFLSHATMCIDAGAQPVMFHDTTLATGARYGSMVILS